MTPAGNTNFRRRLHIGTKFDSLGIGGVKPCSTLPPSGFIPPALISAAPGPGIRSSIRSPGKTYASAQLPWVRLTSHPPASAVGLPYRSSGRGASSGAVIRLLVGEAAGGRTQRSRVFCSPDSSHDPASKLMPKVSAGAFNSDPHTTPPEQRFNFKIPHIANHGLLFRESERTESL